MGILYIVATPIGNLGDITFRALEALKSVDIILCEDTRVTAKLLQHYQINKPLVSYHHHSDVKKVNEIKELLVEGKSLALVTDAGTPGISDPGNELVSQLAKSAIKPQIIASPIQVGNRPVNGNRGLGPAQCGRAGKRAGVPKQIQKILSRRQFANNDPRIPMVRE